MPGTLFVVSTPIGNLEDISARALRILREVAVIAAEDTRRTAGLLAHFGIATPTISLHEHNEAARIPRLLDRLRGGDDVAVVSDAGTPTVSDPGQQMVQAAIDAGLKVEAIPGPSAVLTALAASGFNGDGFVFLGFPPTRSKARSEWLSRLRGQIGVVVFFEAPHRVTQTLAEVVAAVGGDTPALIARELTKVHEELVRGPIETLMERLGEPRGEYTIVLNIGHMPDLVAPREPGCIDWLAEIGHITDSMRLSRRKAVNVLAKRVGMAPNEVYAAVERAKKLVK